MGLALFDNIWYCDKCGERIKDEDEFIYCPKCGNVLKNDWYQIALESIENYLNNSSKSICEDCCEEFDEDYNFCPLCSNELKKESIMKSVEKDNSIIADWNGEEVIVFDKDIFLSSPNFSGSAVIDCFKWKDYLDDKLERNFIEINAKPPQKLSFKETLSIFIKGDGRIRSIIKFLPEYNEGDFDDGLCKQETFKIRPDLYVILVVDYSIIY